MEKKIVFYVSFAAALIAFSCTLFMGFCMLRAGPCIKLQPSDPSGTVNEFMRPIINNPKLLLQFFTADSMFVLSYLVVFVGLFTVVVGRSRTLACIGLGAGILAALFDAIENSFFITYAKMSLNKVPLPDPALPFIYIVANLKLMGVFAAFFVLGLVWPRDNWLGKIVSGLMLLFVLVGVLSIIFQSLVEVSLLILLLGMPLFAWYFWKQARKI
jgi:hypothetical protein